MSVTRYLVETVRLAVPEGHTGLTDLEITHLCNGDTPNIERRKIDSKHATEEQAREAARSLIEGWAGFVMVTVMRWEGERDPDITKPGQLHCPGAPRLTVLALWERPYHAKLSRYSSQRGITVRLGPWAAGTSAIKDWDIGGGEWPVWNRPVFQPAAA
ncbi:hypothetical protein [Paracidovorax citrulli]|uniref:hypothetical protein n=1 Tax=Paracidovorax citrulli TaxID=80869 RepID=UPI0005FBB04A|nr:hypothetical protein [Paracidovorax citrulli]